MQRFVSYRELFRFLLSKPLNTFANDEYLYFGDHGSISLSCDLSQTCDTTRNKLRAWGFDQDVMRPGVDKDGPVWGDDNIGFTYDMENLGVANDHISRFEDAAEKGDIDILEKEYDGLLVLTTKEGEKVAYNGDDVDYNGSYVWTWLNMCEEYDKANPVT